MLEMVEGEYFVLLLGFTFVCCFSLTSLSYPPQTTCSRYPSQVIVVKLGANR
jgi:hypothetical protein